jgi:2-polyprenyl-3-methyl-5-hydroxy-6-metoxy-1,4-benzoquinol methylase
MSATNFTERQQCPACGATAPRELYRRPYADPALRAHLTTAYAVVGNGIEYDYVQDAQFVLDECTDCGLIYQRFIPDDALMERLYERWIDPQVVFARHQQSDNLAYHSRDAAEIMQLIHFFGGNPHELAFFDFGMGWGKWARMANAFGCAAFGTELSPTRIAYAEANGVRVLRWEEIPKQQFDFINTDQVFEHLPAPLATLHHLAQALKPAGLLKISVPDGGDIKRRLAIGDWQAPKSSKHSLNPVSPLEHINCFNRHTLVTMAAAAGLQETTLPLTTQFAFATNWQLPKPALKNLLLPLRRNLLRQGTNLLFRHAS